MSALWNSKNFSIGQGKLEECIPMRKCIEIGEKSLGLTNSSTAQGKHEEALPLYQHSRAIREKVFGPDHPSVAESLNNEAVLLSDMVSF